MGYPHFRNPPNHQYQWRAKFARSSSSKSPRMSCVLKARRKYLEQKLLVCKVSSSKQIWLGNPVKSPCFMVEHYLYIGWFSIASNSWRVRACLSRLGTIICFKLFQLCAVEFMNHQWWSYSYGQLNVVIFLISPNESNKSPPCGAFFFGWLSERWLDINFWQFELVLAGTRMSTVVMCIVILCHF